MVSSIGLLIKQNKVIKGPYDDFIRLMLDFNKLPMGVVMDWYSFASKYGEDDLDSLYGAIEYKKIANFSDSELEEYKDRPDMYDPMLAFNKEIPMNDFYDFGSWCEKNNFDTETLEEYEVIAYAKAQDFTEEEIEYLRNNNR